MALTISFDLDDDDLKHFRGLMKQAKSVAKEYDEEDILTATDGLLLEMQEQKLPAFVRDRVGIIENMQAMLRDAAFALPAPERKRILSGLAYFLEPDDLIADDIPVLGFLDDAIMIELIGQELQHETQAYKDFCAFRETEARRRGVDIPMDREKWLESKRQQLIGRIRDRRSRSRTRGRRSGRSPFSLF